MPDGFPLALVVAETWPERLHVAGVVLNHTHPADYTADPSLRSNRVELSARCIPPIVAELNFNAKSFNRVVDWRALAHQAD